MKMWKRHKSEPRPIEVECEIPAYPNPDADGDKIYDHSHFKTEEDCWAAIERRVLASLSNLGAKVLECRARLVEAERAAGDKAAVYSRFNELRFERDMELRLRAAGAKP